MPCVVSNENHVLAHSVLEVFAPVEVAGMLMVNGWVRTIFSILI